MTAEFRSVHTRMWREDEWFQELPTDARLLFIYLFTNPSASVCGIYRLPLRTIVFESGLEQARVLELLAEYSRAGKAHYENGIVWVVRMRENQIPGKLSPKLEVRLERDIESIPYCELKRKYMIRYGYPIDTVSIPRATDTDTDTVTDTDTDTDTPRGGGGVRPAPAPPVGVTLDPDYAAVADAYHNAGFGMLSVVLADTLKEYLADYGRNWTEDAIVTAARSGKLNLNYVGGILRRWKANGKDTPATTPHTNGNGYSNGNGNGYRMSPADRTRAAFEEVERMLAEQEEQERKAQGKGKPE